MGLVGHAGFGMSGWVWWSVGFGRSGQVGLGRYVIQSHYKGKG